MKNTYIVNLLNEQGRVFDSASFTNLTKARKWASHRGGNYKVYIYVNNDDYPSICYIPRHRNIMEG